MSTLKTNLFVFRVSISTKELKVMFYPHKLRSLFDKTFEGSIPFSKKQNHFYRNY